MTSRELFRVERLSADSAGAAPVLGLDTGTSVASIALFADGKIAGERLESTASHARTVPVAVAGLLEHAGVKLDDLSAIAVGLGPGSFTGLRVGLSYAKGIVVASGRAIVGVPSLDAVAIGALDACGDAARPGRLVVPIVDARKGEVYAALYRIVADGLEKTTGNLVVPLNRLVSMIDEAVIVVGDSRANDAAALLNQKGLEVADVGRGALDTRARVIAAIGAARAARHDLDRPESLEPLYVRPHDAGSPAVAARRQEGLWSAEKKSSSASTWNTMKN